MNSQAVEAYARERLTGRKFVDDDVRANADLRVWAVEFAATADQATGFMGDMAATVRRGRGLTAPQARGVLNVWLAGYRRQAVAAEATANPQTFALAGLADVFEAARKHLRDWQEVRRFHPHKIETAEYKARLAGPYLTPVAEIVYEPEPEPSATREPSPLETAWASVQALSEADQVEIRNRLLATL